MFRAAATLGFLRLALLLEFARGCLIAAAQPTATKPNRLVILAGDLGWGGMGCYDPRPEKSCSRTSTASPPRAFAWTKRLSGSGVCSPSRYALLTGGYRWRPVAAVAASGEDVSSDWCAQNCRVPPLPDD